MSETVYWVALRGIIRNWNVPPTKTMIYKRPLNATIGSENYKIILPEDLIIDDNGNRKTIGIDEAGTYNTTTGDIGEKTVEKFNEILMKCKTIIANGPPGIFEKEVFRKATNEIVNTMVTATRKNNALTIIGGGEMGAAASMAGKADDVSFISTAGGAMLEILSGKDLPMIRALREKKA